MRIRRLIGGATILAAVLGLVSASSSGAATVVVEELSPGGWMGGNEGPVESVGKANLKFGPAIAPAGKGSAMLEIDDTGRASLGTLAFKGTLLSTITQLTYSSYVSSAKMPAAPSLQFDVDYDASDQNTAYQGRLRFNPPGVPTPDTWVAQDALAGKWYATGAPGNSVCPSSSPCTWAQILAAFPNAAVRNDPVGSGALLFRIGGPVAGGAIAYVDNFTITVGGTSTTFDFEPGATVNPAFGPAGTVILIQAEGFKPDANVSVYYYTNARRPQRVKICQAPAWDGTFYCAVPIPNVALAGEPGVHSIRVIGPRRIVYNASFLLSP